MADWPSLKQVRLLLRLQPDTAEDALIDQARLAAIDWCNRRTGYRFDDVDGDLPDAVYQAATLLAARWYRRRDSLDGTIGWGDLGVIRVGNRDPDVEALLAPWLPVVFG